MKNMKRNSIKDFKWKGSKKELKRREEDNKKES
jgi:hypothetical protein